MATFESYANSAQTTLNGSINASVTSITVSGASGFPSSGQYRILIDSEIMLVTGGLGTTTWTVARSQENTIAQTHNNSATVTHVLTAASLLTKDYLDIRAFGGVGDGTTDNTAAFNAALAAAATTGATIFFPASANPYNFASAWSLASKSYIRIKGAGSTGTGGANTPSLISFTGTTGPLISAGSSNGLEIEDLYFLWPAAFAGTVCDFSSTTLNRLTRCFFESVSGHSAAVVVGLDNATRCVIDRCIMHGATVGIQGIGTTGHFSNIVDIRDCNFSSLTGDIATAIIQNPGQGWLIQNNTFEMGSGAGTPNAIGSTLGGGAGVAIIGNWFSDYGTGAYTTVDVNGDGWFISGNEFAANSNASTVLINLRSGTKGATIMGNELKNAGIAVQQTGNLGFFYAGNKITGITTEVSGSASGGLALMGQDSKIKTYGSTPTLTNVNAGISGTPTVTGNNTCGTISTTIGGSNLNASSRLYTVNLTAAYPSNVVVILSGGSGGNATYYASNSSPSASTFDVSTVITLGANNTYTLYYFVIS